MPVTVNWVCEALFSWFGSLSDWIVAELAYEVPTVAFVGMCPLSVSVVEAPFG